LALHFRLRDRAYTARAIPDPSRRAKWLDRCIEQAESPREKNERDEGLLLCMDLPETQHSDRKGKRR